MTQTPGKALAVVGRRSLKGAGALRRLPPGVPDLLHSAQSCHAIVLAWKAGPARGGVGGAGAARGWREAAAAAALGAPVTAGAGRECKGREGVRAGTWGPYAPPLAIWAAAEGRRRCSYC